MTTRPHVPVPEEVNVSVVVRVRPPLEREKQLGYSKCLSVDPLCHSLTVFQTPAPSISTNVSLKPLSPPQPTPRTFTFDYVADEFVNQEEMFTSVGKPMAHACLQGYHCCLIAYGQTGAGKTYTMEERGYLHACFHLRGLLDMASAPSPMASKSGSGSLSSASNSGFYCGSNTSTSASSPRAANSLTGSSLHTHLNELDDMSPEVTEKCGLIPRILETIFLILAAEKAQSGVDVDFSVRCSSLQIYNEQVEDLLCPDSTNLSIPFLLQSDPLLQSITCVN